MLSKLSSDAALRGPHMVDERRKMEYNSVKFEALAVGVLGECHSADSELTRQMLEQKVPFFGKKTAIDVAYTADSLDFLSHSAAQDKITNVRIIIFLRRTVIKHPLTGIFLTGRYPSSFPPHCLGLSPARITQDWHGAIKQGRTLGSILLAIFFPIFASRLVNGTWKRGAVRRRSEGGCW